MTTLRELLAISRVPPAGASAPVPVGDERKAWLKAMKLAFDEARPEGEPREERDELFGSYVVELQCACLGVLDSILSSLVPGGGDLAANAKALETVEGGLHAVAVSFPLLSPYSMAFHMRVCGCEQVGKARVLCKVLCLLA